MNTSVPARFFKPAVFAAAMTVVSVTANAALYDRGNGMIYDSTLNITWLQDANYARTSGYDTDGKMTWYEAKSWSENLVYGGFSDWRLASAGLNNIYACDALICPDEISNSGLSDKSFNNVRSEIGNLFNRLGNFSYYSIGGDFQKNYGLTKYDFYDESRGEIVGFLNVENDFYWELESAFFYSNFSWAFALKTGYNSYYSNASEFFSWAVRDGDVLAVNEVPVPAAAWLMGSSLLGLAGLARHNNKK